IAVLATAIPLQCSTGRSGEDVQSAGRIETAATEDCGVVAVDLGVRVDHVVLDAHEDASFQAGSVDAFRCRGPQGGLAAHRRSSRENRRTKGPRKSATATQMRMTGTAWAATASRSGRTVSLIASWRGSPPLSGASAMRSS